MKVYNNYKRLGVKSSDIYHVNHKQDTIFSIHKLYNKQGVLTGSKSRKKGKIVNQTKLHYLNDTLVSSFVSEGLKHKDSSKYEYNELGNLSSYKKFTDNELRYEISKTFDGKLLKSEVKKNHKRRKIITYKTVNTIEDDRIIKTEYFKNGKLKRLWEYDCEAKGVEVALKSKETKVPTNASCHWKSENSDGSYITYNRTLDNKGRVRLSEYHMDKDSNLVLLKIYNHKEKLSFEKVQKSNVTIHKNYKNNCKISSYNTTTVDDQLRIISSTQYNSGLFAYVRNSNYDYKENGLINSVERFHKKKVTRIIHDYNYW